MSHHLIQCNTGSRVSKPDSLWRLRLALPLALGWRYVLELALPWRHAVSPWRHSSLCCRCSHSVASPRRIVLNPGKRGLSAPRCRCGRVFVKHWLCHGMYRVYGYRCKVRLVYTQTRMGSLRFAAGSWPKHCTGNQPVRSVMDTCSMSNKCLFVYYFASLPRLGAVYFILLHSCVSTVLLVRNRKSEYTG